jgi:membrane dipeptidase
MLVFDSHLDLGMNALLWNRDLTQPVAEIRRAEAGMPGKGRGMNTVALPELCRGRVAVSVATVLARTGASPAPNLPSYRSAEIAYAMAQGQLAYYRVLASQDKLRMIATREELEAHIHAWESWDEAYPGGEGETPPPGMILSMEGGDPIVSPEQVASWWQDGLRAIGLAHYQESAYAHGTGSEGGLKPPARPLLGHMRSLGMILDLTHLADESFWEALKLWDGPVMASHNNCRELVPGDRQFSDEQLRAIIERAGVIGCALDAWMLYPGWVRGETSPEVVGLEALIDHIDHICELAGNAQCVAIGSDLDGGFGKEQTPHDLDTIADLQKLQALLRGRGYNGEEIRAIMYGNWLRFFLEHLP